MLLVLRLFPDAISIVSFVSEQRAAFFDARHETISL
jgi:hypothetical protein